MKKFIFSMICTLLPIFASAQVQNEELTPYAVLSGDHTVLKFFYDNDKESQGGMDVGPFTSADGRGWNEHCESIGHVIFDGSFANYTPTSTSYWFDGFTNLTQIDGLENLNTENVTDMAYMFAGCSSLTSLDLGGFDTSNAIYLSGMFMDCSGLTNLDLENFNTSKATDMDYMFYGCSSLTSLEVSGFNTAEAKYMDSMFAGCSSLISLDLSNFNTSNVNTMDGMFAGCSSLTNLDVSGFEKITGLSHMFQDCSSLTSLDLSNFDTSNTYSMEYTFAGCSGLTSLDLSNFNTEKVTTMYGMFYGCSGLTSLDLSEFDTSNTTKLNQMFWGCSGLTSLNVTGFDTSKATDMSHMFTGCSKLTSLELSNFDTSNVTTMGGMFDGCSSLTSLTLGENFDTSNVTTMGSMFYGCSSLTSLDLSNFNTSNVTGMGMMFDGCSSLTILIFGENFDTSNVTTMNQMFWGCSGLTSLNVTGFDTSKATDMSYMFSGCSSLTSLDLSNFNTSNVTEMQSTFSQCSGLETIYVGNGWSTENIESGGDMFTGCTVLVGGEGTTYDANHVDYTYAHIDKATDPGYLAEKLDYNEGDFFTTETVEGVTMSFRVDDATQRICRVMAPEEDQRAIDTATTGTVTIPAKAHGYTVNRIHDYAFQDCAGVTEFVIPNSVKSIEQCAFKRCTSLTTVHIPASVTTIDGLNGKPWVGCTSLTTITVDEENPKFDSRDDCNAIMETADDILYMGCKGTKIPETTKVIGHSSFDSMGELPALEIPASVTSIVAYAFWECSFPSVTSYIEEPFETSSVWDHLPANCPLYVPQGKVEAYKAVSEWSNFTTIVEIGSSEAYAALNEDNTKLTFYYDNKKEERGGMSVGPFTESSQRGWDEQREKIEQVVFNESFANCTTITSTKYWFAGITNLTTLTGLDNLKTENVTDMSYMFSGCSSLTNLDLSSFTTSSVTDMQFMFSQCSGLETIYVGNGWSLESISSQQYGAEMFAGCTALVGGAGTIYDPDHVNVDYAHIDGGSSNPGYLSGSGQAVPYAVLNEDNTVLTFYYDDQKAKQNGMSVGPFTLNPDDNGVGHVNSGWYEQRENIEQVVFNESFANCPTITSTSCWFYSFTKLTAITGLANLKTDNVTNMSRMFEDCSSLTSLDVSGFDTSKTTDMSNMFGGCSGLTSLDVTGFDTSNVTNLAGMFAGCSSLTSLDVTGFDTSKATIMGGMFRDCSGLASLDVSNFNTSNVTAMHFMFYGCSNLTSLDVTGFDTSNVTGMMAMFELCEGLTSLDLSGFNTSKVGDMSSMFMFCSSLESIDLSNFNTSNVTNLVLMFYGCSNLTNLDVSGFDTSNATHLSGMFYGCSSLTSLDVTGFDTSNATTLHAMFANCSNLTNLDLSSFNTSNVTDMQLMFSQCSGLETILVGNGWSTESITSEEAGADMFTECTALIGGAGTTYDTDHVNVDYAHIDGGTSSPGYLSGSGQAVPYAVLSDNNTLLTFYYDDQKVERNGMSVGPFTLDVDPVTSFVDKVSSGWNEQRENIEKVVFDNSFAECTTITSTRYWFYGCNNLISIKGLENLKTNNVTNMSYMFNECKSLTSLDLTGFDTSSVTDMSQMFLSCSSLTSLDVTKFNTSEVTHMTQMFQGCSGLTSLDVSNFKTSKTINFNNMFYSCSSLKSLDVSGFDTSIANYMSYMFAKCASLTNLDLSNFNTSEVVDMFGMFSQCSRLETIYVGDKWSTGSILSEDRGAKIFEGCTALVGGAGTTYDENHVDYAYAHIDGGTTNPGYLSGSGQAVPYAVLNEDNSVLTFYYDDQKAARGGMDVGPFDDGGKKNGSGWSEVNEEITTVVFDDSFANCTTLTSTAYWFYGCENLTTIKNFSNLKTDNVTDINSMFGDCHSLKSIDFSSLNLSKVTNMHQVFEDCRTLESVNFSGVNTENVTDMSDLFLNCHNLKTIDISSFNTKNVTNMKSMFLRCDVLTTIYVGEEWTTENVTESESMFRESPNLVGGRGTTYDANHVGIEYAHIDGGTSNPGYLTDINGSGGASDETWAKLQSRIEYGTDVLAKAKEISSVDQALIEKLDEALQNANQMYKIHEASEDEVLHMIEVLNERINDVEEAMNQPASEETWTELKATIEYGTDVLAKAKEISTIDQWLIEELDMTLDSGNQMYKIHEASEEEVLNMIDELYWRIKEVEEAMNQPASDEAWAELNKAVETGEKLQTEAKGVSTVEPWALEELENMTAKGSEMYKVHTAGEEEVRHMTEELNQIINEVEEMMRKQPQGEASFDGLTAYVSGNATLDDAFKSVGGRSEAAKTIAAIVWNADNALTADMLSGIDNPNLLVYVTEASKAPSGVQNVIIDGVASEIVLTDATGNNNFYCPQSFTAKSISYSRDFSQTTEIDVCRGWETIALPFDVQSITHESHGTLVPFGGSDNGYPFWLRQLSTNGLARATKIEANRPYLICMPNNIIYPPEYNQNGTVTFSSSNVTVPVTSARSSTSAGVTLHATFQQVTKSSSVYALNVGETRGEYPEGSVFEQNYRDIRPFQAYTTHSAGTRSFITLESIGGNDDATGIEELRIKNSEFGDAEGVWYSLDGCRLDAKPTKKGVYVKDGRKIVIK